MAKIEITVPGERIVEEFTALVSQPTTPTGTQPVKVGLVEISQTQATELIPGPVGPKGEQGVKGDTGAVGPPNVLTVGTVTTVLPTEPAAVSISGTSPTQELSFEIPQGPPGPGAEGVNLGTGTPVFAGADIGTGVMEFNQLRGSNLTTVGIDATGIFISTLVGWADVTGKPIPQSDVANLTTDLAAKANLAGATFTGKVTTPAAGINIGYGTTPGSPVEGDIWFVGTTANIRCGGTFSLAFLQGSQTFTGNKTFAAMLITATPTTSLASIRLPHGVAPTALTNGDMWTTTAGLYARVNGVTVGPMGVADWASITGKPATFPPTVPIAWTDVSGKPATFPPTLPIAQADVTNLTTDLAAKANVAGQVFTGKVTVPACDAGSAYLNIGNGAAVTTAVDGDLYMTSSNFLYRLNGVSQFVANLAQTQTFTGAKTFSADVTIAKATPILIIDKSASGQNAAIQFKTGTSIRWQMQSNNTGETGSNLGSNFNIIAYDDAGASLGSAFSITRSSLQITALGNVVISKSGPTLYFDKSGAAQTATIMFRQVTSNRWGMRNNATAESTGNVGSDFFIDRYNDAGTVIDQPLTITRSTGIVAMPLGATTLTQTAGNNTTSVATTAFVTSAVIAAGGASPSNALPAMDGAAAAGASALYARGDHIHPTDTSKANLASPVFTGDPQAPTPTAGDNDTSVATTAFVASAITATATALSRNRIVNPAMQINQEATVSVTTNAGYICDQWQANFSGAVAVNAQQVAAITPNKSPNRLRYTITTPDTSLATTDFAAFLQRIEGTRMADFGWGAAGARQVILRFGFAANVSGTYSFGLVNAATNRSYVQNFVYDMASPNDKEFTFIIPGDVTGTWTTDTAQGMYLYICMGSGTTYRTTPGSWQAGIFFATASNTNGLGTVSNNFNLFDVGLYLDPNNTGIAPRWEMPDEAEELLACQRYYHSFYGLWNANVTSAANYLGAYVISPPKRTTSPALSATGSAGTGFPAGAGTLTFIAGTTLRDQRAASATGYGVMSATYIINARM